MVQRLLLASLVVGLVLVPLVGAGASAQSRSREVSADVAVLEFDPAANGQVVGESPNSLPAIWEGQQVQSEVRIQNPASRPVTVLVTATDAATGTEVASQSVTVGASTTETVELTWAADSVPFGVRDLQALVEYGADPDPLNNGVTEALFIVPVDQTLMWVSEFEATLSDDGNTLSVSVTVDAAAAMDESRYRGRQANPEDVNVSAIAVEVHLTEQQEEHQHPLSGVTDESGQVTFTVELIENCDDTFILTLLTGLEKEGYLPLPNVGVEPVALFLNCDQEPI